MNISSSAAMLALLAGTLHAGDSVDLSSGWRFRAGDDAAWSAAEFDDSEWAAIEVGKNWEEQGYAELDGYAWYRLRVSIPGDLREHDDFNLTQTLIMELGQIDDVDETWLNGERIGGTGVFPPEYATEWRRERAYPVAANLVRWGEENVIAVRVYDGTNGGGMWKGEPRLRVEGIADLVRISWDEVDAVLMTDESVRVLATVHNSSPIKLSGAVLFTVENDEGETSSTPESERMFMPGAQLPVTGELTPPAPGFYRVTCTVRWDGGEVRSEHDKAFPYRAVAIESKLTRESDFDEFWDHTLAELAQVAPEFELERRSELDTPTHRVYLVTMRSLGNLRVRGWYQEYRLEPSRPKPAVLRVPGYGGAMHPMDDDSAVNYFSFDPRGHGHSTDDMPGQPVDYWLRGLDDKEGYFYQGAYADCVRAVDFLASRPEVDVNRIAITGGSQGGGLSFATAALDSRIALCAPDIPWLCDWRRYFSSTTWPDIESWIAAKPERTWESMHKTLSYFDVLNLVDRIECPVFVGLGLEDDVCPPATIYAVYNRLAGTKQVHTYHSEHWVPGEHQKLKREWIAKQFSVMR